MIPSLFLHRQNLRYNLMTCETPCDNCTCSPCIPGCSCPCDFIPIDADLYVEVDDKTFLPSTTDPRN